MPDQRPRDTEHHQMQMSITRPMKLRRRGDKPACRRCPQGHPRAQEAQPRARLQILEIQPSFYETRLANILGGTFDDAHLAQ